MKTSKISLLALLLMVLTIYSCKKDDNGNGGNTGTILGKWYFEKEYQDDYTAGVHDTSTYFYTPGDYLDFKSDGKVFVSVYDATTDSTYFDSSTYALLNNKIIFDGTDTLDIQTLTNQDLILHQLTYTGADYSDYTAYLHR